MKQIIADKYRVFDNIPDSYLIIDKEFNILNASNSYLAATYTSREEIVGKNVFSAFPDNPELQNANGTSNLRNSLLQVIKTKKPHAMNVQRYDVKKPSSSGGSFEQKYWIPTNVPVFDEYGDIDFIIHKVLDVTEEIIKNEDLKSLSIRNDQLIEQLIEAKNQIENEKKKFYDFFMQAPAIIAVLKGPDHVYEFTNPNYLKVVGRNDIIGKSVKEVFPELHNDKIFNILDNVYTKGERFSGEEFHIQIDINNDGVTEDLFFNFVYEPYKDQHGNTEGILVHGVDVTNHIENRKLIQASEEKYRTLFNTMDQGFCILKMIFDEDKKPVDYIFQEINPVFEKQTGLKDALGKTAREMVPNLESRWFEIYGKVALTGKAVRFTEGSDVMGRWFEVYAFPIGKPEECLVALLFTDITEKEVTQRALRKSEERLSNIIEGSNDGIWDWDFINDKAWWNERMAQIFGTGTTEEERKFSNMIRNIHPDDRDKLQQAIKNHIEKGEKYEVEFRYQRKDGQLIHLLSKGKAITDESSNLIRMAGITTDITDRKRYEQKLKSKNEQLVKINNDLDNFIYTASLDLKAPVSNIEGLVMAIKEKLHENVAREDDECNMLLDMMEKSVERLKNTIIDLTEISKVQKSPDEDLSNINIENLLSNIQLSIADQIKEANAEIIYDFTNAETICFSRKNINSIMYNLLSNAIKYRHPERKPIIKISTEVNNPYTILTIQDNGLGMSEGSLSKLFTMFKRFHDHVEGTGIGLYIVKRIIDNAGGKIEVESEEGIGTTFRIFFRNRIS